MINRALIRLKVVQLTYAFYQNEGKTTTVALEELDFSLQKAYELYHSLLWILVEIRRIAERKDSVYKAKRISAKSSNERVLGNNKFLLQLESNIALNTYVQDKKISWVEQDALLKKSYESFLNDDVFLQYVDKADYSYEADREVVRKLYKNILMNNDLLDDILEEKCLYWNDDKDIIDSFVLKTIKRFKEALGEEQTLLPAYAAEEDQEFAGTLFRKTIEQSQETRTLIGKNTKKWDFSRLAFMDVVIMQIALTEILNFSSIPLSVSFNEYLDIAKVYSTPRSPSYIHGMLDGIVKKLKEEGRVLK